jgi:hypothetical protein
MSLMDLASQQQPPNANAPGGPPPDPRTLYRRDIPPPPPIDIPQLGQRRADQNQPDQSQQPGASGAGPGGMAQDGFTQVADASADATFGSTPGFWRQGVAPSMYAPHTPNRAPKEWGEPSWRVKAQQSYNGILGGVNAPDPSESYPLIASSGAQLGQWGAPNVAGPAAQAGMMARRFFPILDMLSSGQFSKNFNAASLGRMKLEQEQMQISLERAELAHRQQMMNYGAIFHEASLGAISPDEAKRRLEGHIYLNDDQILNEILQNKGLGSAEKFLQWRDARMNDLMAGGTAARKASGTTAGDAAEILSAYGESPDGGGIDFPSLPDNVVAQGAQSDAGPGAAAIPFDADYGAQLQKRYGLHDREFDDASALVDGDTPPGYEELEKLAPRNPGVAATQAKILRAADAMRSDIRRIASNPDSSADDKLKSIGFISPKLSDLTRGLLSYHVDPHKDLGSPTQSRDILALAHQLDKNYNSDNYRLAQKYKDPNTKEGTVVQRVTSLTGQLYNVNAAVLRTPENQKVTTNQVEDLIANRFTGDPHWSEIYNATRLVVQDVVAIESGSGYPRPTLVNNMMRHLMSDQSPAQIRAQIMQDVRAASAQIKPVRDEWRQTVNDPNAPLPFLSKDTDETLHAYMLSNPYTGEMPPDAPPSLRAVSRTPDRKNLPSWIVRGTATDPGQDFKPLALKDVPQARALIQKYKDSPDPALRNKATWLMKLLGPFADPGY